MEVSIVPPLTARKAVDRGVDGVPVYELDLPWDEGRFPLRFRGAGGLREVASDGGVGR